jgi:hypothetical protein
MTTFALPSGSYRAASLKQVWMVRAAAVGSAIWRTLEAMGRRRAVAELRHTANLVQASRPELASELRRTAVAVASTR